MLVGLSSKSTAVSPALELSEARKGPPAGRLQSEWGSLAGAPAERARSSLAAEAAGVHFLSVVQGHGPCRLLRSREESLLLWTEGEPEWSMHDPSPRAARPGEWGRQLGLQGQGDLRTLIHLAGGGKGL